jgi:muramoyltetrapeptide carboxypeptidase
MLQKPRALRAGDRVAIVAPASPFSREEFDAGVAELRTLGLDPVYSASVFARDHYLAGPASLRARDLLDAWTDPAIAAVIAARGGYGSVQLLPLLSAEAFRRHPKAFIGYSDNTSLLTWLTQDCGVVGFHGPMIEGRFARGEAGYDRDTLIRCLFRSEPAGEITAPQLETLSAGEALGELVGGTLTQLVGSLGTPFAFEPPAGCVLFLDDVAERPYRLDRMLTQLRQSGLLARTAAIVFNELPRCVEPGGVPTARDTVRMVLKDFPGPILFGLPSGHGDGPAVTIPFGVLARVVAGDRPALVIEEAAVS